MSKAREVDRRAVQLKTMRRMRDWRRKPPLRPTVPRAQLQRVSETLNNRDILR
jgi:hypothetical protein